MGFSDIVESSVEMTKRTKLIPTSSTDRSIIHLKTSRERWSISNTKMLPQKLRCEIRCAKEEAAVQKLSLRIPWAKRSELRKLRTACEVPDYAESLTATFADVPYVAAKYVQKTRESKEVRISGESVPPADITDAERR